MYVNEMDVRLAVRQVGDLIRTEADPDVRRALIETLWEATDRTVREIAESITADEAQQQAIFEEGRPERLRLQTAAARARRWDPAYDPVLTNYVVIDLRWKSAVDKFAWARVRSVDHPNGPAGRPPKVDQPGDRPP
jgi:hypothetical protein